MLPRHTDRGMGEHASRDIASRGEGQASYQVAQGWSVRGSMGGEQAPEISQGGGVWQLGGFQVGGARPGGTRGTSPVAVLGRGGRIGAGAARTLFRPVGLAPPLCPQGRGRVMAGTGWGTGIGALRSRRSAGGRAAVNLFVMICHCRIRTVIRQHGGLTAAQERRTREQSRRSKRRTWSGQAPAGKEPFSRRSEGREDRRKKNGHLFPRKQHSQNKTGQALSCIQCVSFGNRSCDGLSVSCRLDNVCGASYTVTTSGFSVVSRIYMRVCVPKNQCNLQGSVSVINVMSRFGGSCCNTDNCTPDLPTLPAVNTTFNGLVCRTCVSADSDWCYTKDTVQCTGNENMCLLQTTSITGEVSMNTALRGCTTKSLCDLSQHTAEYAGQKLDVRFICTGGTAGLYSGLTLSLVAILLTNII
uniref:UPAR/Ly6 domain-containing protein n=1 Tax=Leptobrachium leishanense TaxID=445787 RepID=A0A8C5W6X5_9ANUR